MSHLSLAADAIVFVMAGAAVAFVPRTWRGWFTTERVMFRGQLRTYGEVAFWWWPYGESSRRGVVRALVAADAGICGMALAVAAEDAAIYLHGLWSQVLHGAALMFFGLFLLGLLLCCSVIFFNRPQFIVPPCQRGEKGLLTEWRAERSRRR